MRQSRSGSRAVALVFLVGAGVLFARAALADTEEGARKHANKGNQLAAKNKCNAAIFEFTRALKTLKDPALLFNRAECFRKVGRNDEAISDYEQFLVDMPRTPNRAAVESRLAALKSASKAAAPPAEATPAEVKPSPPVPAAPAAAKAVPAPPSGDSLAKPASAVPPKSAPPAPAPAPKPAPTAPAAKAEDRPAPPPAHKAEKWTD